MKQVFYYLMAMVFITSCNRYTYELSDPGLTVVESVLDFTASGGEGYIVVESATPITATSNSDWCQISVNGLRIEVSVAVYDGLENRTAVVAVSTGDGYPVNVPVTQFATRFIIENLSLNVDFVETTVKTSVIADNAVTVATTFTWIDAWYENDSIYITVAQNPNASIRTGNVTVTSGVVTQTIVVTQAAYSIQFEDLLGNWQISYQTSATSARTTRNISFAQSATEGYYNVTGLQLGTLSVRFNNDNRTLEIYAGQNMGTYNVQGNYFGWTIAPLMISTNNYVTWSNSIYYRGVWNNVIGQGMIFTFEDSGTWAGYTINGMCIVLSNQYPVVSGSYEYTNYLYYNIIMTKL